LTPSEIEFLQDAFKADYKLISIRLREGEHQFGLAKAIASFQLELSFPDVKDIIKRVYGENRTADVQLVRKIQTILKKMEKSGIVKILPKKKPWELQKYALSSFKFQDIDKNMTALATDQQIEQAQNLLNSTQSQLQEQSSKFGSAKVKVYAFALVLAVVASYATIVWEVMQPAISAIIFVSAFSVAIAGSVALGKMLSRLDLRAPLDTR
jgi:multidrug efflux pump subunit AcrA (membrane-fusion protein)